MIPASKAGRGVRMEIGFCRAGEYRLNIGGVDPRRLPVSFGRRMFLCPFFSNQNKFYYIPHYMLWSKNM